MRFQKFTLKLVSVFVVDAALSVELRYQEETCRGGALFELLFHYYNFYL